jgi:hypothetical protein
MTALEGVFTRQRDAERHARVIIREAGGGEIVIHSRSGHVVAAEVVHAALPHHGNGNGNGAHRGIRSSAKRGVSKRAATAKSAGKRSAGAKRSAKKRTGTSERGRSSQSD